MSEEIQKISAVLFDAIRDHESEDIDIEVTSSGISIRPQGTGTSTEVEGAPIFIEKCDGVWRVIVWGDINQEDPTQVITIDLKNAKEELYKEEENV